MAVSTLYPDLNSVRPYADNTLRGTGDLSADRFYPDHWEPFQHAHPRYRTPYYDGLVDRDSCASRQPEKIGLCRSTAACGVARARTRWP